MARGGRTSANTCACCGGSIYAWVPLPATDPLLALPECLECGMLTCLRCRVDHILGHDHRACTTSRILGQ